MALNIPPPRSPHFITEQWLVLIAKLYCTRINFFTPQYIHREMSLAASCIAQGQRKRKSISEVYTVWKSEICKLIVTRADNLLSHIMYPLCKTLSQNSSPLIIPIRDTKDIKGTFLKITAVAETLLNFQSKCKKPVQHSRFILLLNLIYHV